MKLHRKIIIFVGLLVTLLVPISYSASIGQSGGGSESDPQVGAVTNNKWCIGDGSAVQCNQAAPAGVGDMTKAVYDTGDNGKVDDAEDVTCTGCVADSELASSFVKTETDSVVGAVSGIVKANGAGTISAASAGTDYLTPNGDGSGLSGVVTTETDPVTGAINGIVKSNGAGTISAASAGTDYLLPNGDGSGLSGVVTSETDPQVKDVTSAKVCLGTGTQVDCSTTDLPDGTTLNSAAIQTGTEDDQPDNDSEVPDAITVNMQDGSTLPHGTGVTVDAEGEPGIDTTDDQFVYYGSAKRVIPYTDQFCKTVQLPQTSDDNVPLFIPVDAITVTSVYCKVSGGTSVEVTLGDGTNSLEMITCDADGQADDGSIANGTFSAGEAVEMDTGTVTGAVNWNVVCVRYTTDAQ